MSKLICPSMAAIVFAFAGSAGCLDASDKHERDETRTSAQALSGNRARIFYYSDDTYSTQTGHYFSNCYGATNVSGTRPSTSRGS